jgi:Flp pilus assembly protein TadG
MRGRRAQRGVAMVEFAIVAGLFFLLVMLLLDVGKAVYIKNTIDAAAREGARRAVVLNNPTLSDIEAVIHGHSSDVSLASPCAYDSTHPAPTGNNVGFVYVSLRPSGLEGGYNVSGCSSLPAQATGHVPITVTIIYRYVPITPLIGQFLGGGLTFVSTSTMTTEY